MSDCASVLLYNQSGLPVFQNQMYATEAAARNCLIGDVELVEDGRTGLIYNRTFRPEVMVYGGNYQNEQAVSPAFRVHLVYVAGIVERTMGRNSLIEIGCGKGAFLDLLASNGADISGFDPTYEGRNPKVHRLYYRPGLDFHAKGLILRHVLEHVPDPYRFLWHLRQSNKGSGLIYIEVPCFEWICQHRAWFDIFHEHVNYFRLNDFRRMFSDIIDCGNIFGGQYIYVVAELASLTRPTRDTSDPITFPRDFLRTLRNPDSPLGFSSCIWGGASKGTIFALMKRRIGEPVTRVVDINPAKQGKYLAVTGLRVQAPVDALKELAPGSTIYVMNSNYLNEIRYMSDDKYTYIGVDQ
jgi:SAM-dependent methyltransferase